jgi:hypothetical protein
MRTLSINFVRAPITGKSKASLMVDMKVRRWIPTLQLATINLTVSDLGQMKKYGPKILEKFRI